VDTPDYKRDAYWARINRAIDYIERHIDGPLSLHDIATVAHFSPFHFHRIFGALVGETLNQFIQRVRVERAASQLLANPRKSITEVALDCGYASSATFARAFREAYGMSATEWRARPLLRKDRKTDRKDGNTLRKDRQAPEATLLYPADGADGIGAIDTPDRRYPMETTLELKVRIEDLPDLPVAYVRHIGPYAGNAALFQDLFGRLMRWAGPRNLIRFPETKVLIVYHDDPNVTDQSRLRTSVCISVPPGTAGSGEVGTMVVPGGRYACGHCEITAAEFGPAWNALCGGWLPDSGYQPDDRPCFELCLNDPAQHPAHKHLVDLCIPVRPL
jgi:AraC family transcriptional regulator